ncbi:hypothetical protein L861_06425 [Litchfieldella anticariensis FP35 = DSM 16096]|uniref:Uncharacterized protein n=1 Tax=Litchfieldella anticariensis (strain DSM 16096 / CECT 5854 / CIP 108499 / LMG 22089 / FP35) TaxID=1121939 RepID=S2KYU2_LITA3|nr:hypothetical protein L861_06425 [Halomonas anticariensis FP35 = DSM 16096]
MDTVYARLKSEFGFRSRADFSPNDTADKLAMMDAAWHHEATPGAYYRLSDYVTQMMAGRAVRIVLRAEIRKEGQGTGITLAYAPADSLYDGEAMGAALKARAEHQL